MYPIFLKKILDVVLYSVQYYVFMNRLFNVINIMCSFNERSLCDATLNEFITRFSLFLTIAYNF